jgi:hypothetical protein
MVGYNKNMIDIRTMPHIVVDNVFTEEEMSAIYKKIDNITDTNLASGKDKYEGFFRVKSNGFLVYTDDHFSEFCTPQLRTRIEELTGIKVTKIGMHFSRYQAYDGLKPRLMPHLDRHSKNANLTMTVQLLSTPLNDKHNGELQKKWPLYVDDIEVPMHLNRGVMFCSNYQLHWRPDLEFAPEDRYDTVLILINQDEPGNPELPDGIFAEHEKFNKLMTTHGHLLKESVEWQKVLDSQATPCTNPDCTIPGCVNGNCEMSDYHHDSNSDYHRRETNKNI